MTPLRAIPASIPASGPPPAGGHGGPAGRLDRPDPSTAVNALSKRR